MEPYADMTPKERFETLNEMAIEYFETTRWKATFARRYGISNQTLTDWTANGCKTLWPVVAMADALTRKRMEVAIKAIQAITS